MTYPSVRAWLTDTLASGWALTVFAIGTLIAVYWGHGLLSLADGVLSLVGLLAAGRVLARYHTGTWLGEATDLTEGETHA